MFSLAKSVVGLALKLRGMSKCRPLYCPVMMRMGCLLAYLPFVSRVTRSKGMSFILVAGVRLNSAEGLMT